MKVAEAISELTSGKIRPAYLVAGSEPLLRDEAMAAIAAAVLADASRDFNYDRFEVSSSSPARVEDSLDCLPMMSPHRLVCLQTVEGRGGKFDAKWSDMLERYLARMLPDASSVLVVLTTKVDKRQKWVKAFRDPSAMIECEAPTKPRELAAFLEQEATRQDVVLDPDAAALLVDRIGPQLLLLRQEIEKAALLAGPGEKIDRRHVEASVATVAEEPIWDLTDAIGQGRSADALDQLARLLAQGSAAPAILGALASHFRRLVRVGHGDSVNGSPFIIRKLEQQARRYPTRRLVVCLRAIHRTDVELKGASVMRPERALEQLVLGLAS